MELQEEEKLKMDFNNHPNFENDQEQLTYYIKANGCTKTVQL